MSTQNRHDAAVQQLGDLITNSTVAMLTTAEPDGTLRSRPMITQQTPFDGVLWFYTKADDPKVDEVQRDQRVNVSYAEPQHNRFISVSGTAQVVYDRQQIEALWHPVYEGWFPEGLRTPNLALLKVEVDQAEYWDVPTSRMIGLSGLGQQHAAGAHEKLQM